MSDQEIRDRLIRLETIIGDDRSGLFAELHSLKKSVEELKGWQVKIMSVVGTSLIIVQILVQVFILK